MTIKQLIPILSQFPEDTIVAHEVCGQREYESVELQKFEYDFYKKRVTLKN